MTRDLLCGTLIAALVLLWIGASLERGTMQAIVDLLQVGVTK